MKLRCLLTVATALLALPMLTTDAWAHSVDLPIWREEAEALGYELPKPIGLNLSYMSMEQGIAVDSIILNGINIPFLDLDLKAKPGQQKTDVMTLRADVWLFPFLNLYALAGKLEGYSSTDVTVTPKFKAPTGSEKSRLSFNINDFRLDLDGYTYGVGMVLAGGHGNWFGLVDASYTQSNLSVIEGNIDAVVISPRVGYDFNQQGLPLRVWVGAMYQDVEQYLKGSTADLGLPSSLGGLLEPDAGFEVTQHLTTPWNPLIGAQYEINKSWYLLTEIGLGDRQSFFFTIDRRF